MEDPDYYRRLPVVRLEERYTYANLYMQMKGGHALIVATIAISDYNEDHHIIQYFAEREITEFITHNIWEKDLTEDWLICQTFLKPEKFFFGMPMVVPSKSAKEICRFVKEIYKEKGYFIRSPHEEGSI